MFLYFERTCWGYHHLPSAKRYRSSFLSSWPAPFRVATCWVSSSSGSSDPNYPLFSTPPLPCTYSIPRRCPKAMCTFATSSTVRSSGVFYLEPVFWINIRALLDIACSRYLECIGSSISFTHLWGQDWITWQPSWAEWRSLWKNS